MASVIAGIGIPGSGKTTVLKALAEKLNYRYVSPDEIRTELTGDPLNQTRNTEVWELAFIRMKDALEQNRSVVFDATQARPESRAALIQETTEGGAERVIGVYFNVPLEVARERNLARNHVVPEHALRRMHGLLEKHPPSIDDGFDVIISPLELERFLATP